MPFKIKGQIEGLEGTLAVLKSADAKVRKKILRKACNKAGGVLLKRAKQLVPTKSKLLKKSLGRKVKVYPSGVAVAVVGPRKGFRQEVVRDGREVLSDPIRYAHLVEGGTRPHGYKTRGGRHPGAKARPFLKPSLDSTKSTVKKVIANTIAEGLQEAANAGKGKG